MTVSAQMQPITAELRDDEGRSLSVTILRRENPNTTDYWDANWLTAEIGVQGRSFRGACSASLLAQELVALRDDIAGVIANDNSELAFTTAESNLTIRTRSSSTGTYTVQASVGDPGSVEVLEVVLSAAWSDVSRFRDGLSRIVDAYAVVGRPNG